MPFRSRGSKRSAADGGATPPSALAPTVTGNATAVQTTTSRLDRDGWDPASRDASSTPDESASQDLAVALSVRLPGAPLDEVVLASCGTQFTWEDVVGWMRDDGSWAMAARRAAEGASLAADGVAAPSADRLRAQAQQFRRARHLVAGEDLLRWLAHWGISEEEWVDWLDRTLRREAAATPSRLTRAVDEQATWVEVVCSGDLEEAASDLVRVVASWAERTGGSPPPARGRFEALRRAADELASVPVPRADIERAVTGNAAAWVQVALEWADFGTLDAAREAVATMRDDAMPLGAVAELARVEADDAVVRAEDLDARTRAVAISAPIDSPVLVGTSQDPGVVAVVRARRHPSADHPDDAALAVELCVQERVQAAIDRWVTRRA